MKDLLKGIESTPEEVMPAFSSSRPHPPVNYPTKLSHSHIYVTIILIPLVLGTGMGSWIR
jgi:hypothetical protein